MPLSSIMPDAIILCGGAGLRIRSVTGGAPKSMATVAGRPFLELLFRQLSRYGLKRVILALGYRKEAIIAWLSEHEFSVDLAFATEDVPLGTGGAVRNAVSLAQSDTLLVINGDSYTDVDFSSFAKVHESTEADLSVVVVPADGRRDIGSVFVDKNDRLTGFAEKQSGADLKPHVSAGIYMMSRRLLNSIPAGVQISLEKDLFPRWIEEGKDVRAFRHPGHCIDIGTPDRYQIAQQMLANVEVDSVPPIVVK
jgi:D-glycero-alpha-D-manno-heptose 1-phosphate guanylyltransferase